MTHRELFREIMFYGKFDRVPLVHWWQWDETLARWQNEGLPKGTDLRKFLNVSQHWGFVCVNVDLFPLFAEETMEETAEYRVYRDGYGVIQKAWKNQSSIPHYIDFTLKEAKDWPAFKERLQANAARLPKDLAQQVERANTSGLATAFATGSMMGWIRNWMGVENMCYLMFDAPDVYADMVDTLADLTCWAIDQVAPMMKQPFDMGFGWEDICGKSGPLVSPDIFARCVTGGYRKMRAKLEEHGCKLLGIDCDGLIEPLIQHWLDAGVNTFFPVEIGTWEADPWALRQRFGRDMRIIGGFNKMVLEQDRAAIDAEIARRMPLIKDGGFMIMPDHLVTPGTPLANYQYYLDKLREIRI